VTQDADGSRWEKILAVISGTGIPPPLPPKPPPASITFFEAAPSKVTLGQSIKFCYDLSHATGGYIDGEGLPLTANKSAGCQDYTPQRSGIVTYTLHAQGNGPAATATAPPVTILTVPRPPQIKQFAVELLPSNPSPTSSKPATNAAGIVGVIQSQKSDSTKDDPCVGLAGSGVHLAYEVEGATEVRIEPEVTTTDLDPKKGCLSVDQAVQPKTYLLVARSKDGSVAVRPLTLAPPPVAIALFRPDRADLMKGETTAVRYKVDNAHAVEIQLGSGHVISSSQGKGCQNITPTATTIYTLRATALDGTTVSEVTEVRVREPGFFVKTGHALLSFFHAQPKPAPPQDCQSSERNPASQLSSR
jgi:hypothetical protein